MRRCLIVLTFLLAACGQSGDLYLPEDRPAEAAEPDSAGAPEDRDAEPRKDER